MIYSKSQQALMEAMDGMQIIDSHEHLLPEKCRTMYKPDIFILFSHFIDLDLFSSGMDRDSFSTEPIYNVPKPMFRKLFDTNIPLEDRWNLFRPYWNNIRFGSYAKAVEHAVRIVYGINKIDDSTYYELSEKIRDANKPGLYKSVLQDKCNIKAVFSQIDSFVKLEHPLIPVMPGFMLCRIHSLSELKRIVQICKEDIPQTLDGYLSLIDRVIAMWATQGAVGIKITSIYNRPPDYPCAREQYDRLLAGENVMDVPVTNSYGATFLMNIPKFNHLYNYLLHYMIDSAAKHHLTIAVHTGIWDDFREMDPKYLLNLAPEHPTANFDLFHLGMPFIRDAIMIAKNYPNVFLNLCWSHIISPMQTRSAIDEIIDMVPMNKILAFGGDYKLQVENIAGHLYMAKENLAYSFAKRVDSGYMSLSEALEILQQWFYSNPLSIYSRVKIPE
ncbi:amidohydrolase family protein [Paenibacillus mesotrionivorans]|uniref:Amidohydrolase family protein n=1 Tax=Paenibacillus mesotrionivorans TaxID=3160968 RepID=A0ACC7NT16_9BACL